MLRPGRSAMLVAALFLLPGVSASWSGGGALEPDTPYDVGQNRMWLDPDWELNGARIYFNAVLTDTSGLSPNVGALGSRLITPTIKASAWLGLWKDCNQDGYIGFAENALMEYDPLLLNTTATCPLGSRWNHDNWVTEFIHIGPRTAPSDPAQFPRVVTDLSARVWGDFDRPDVFPQPDVACINAPLPRGGLDSTGAILVMVDCNVNYNIANAINEADAILGLGIGFDGPGGHYRPDTDCDNPLNVQLDLYGDSACNPDDPGLLEGRTGHRMVDVWDCAARGKAKFLDVRDPTAAPGGRGQLSSIPDPQTGETLILPFFGPAYLTDNDGTYGVPFLGGGIYAQVDNGNPLGVGVNDTDGSLADSITHFNDGLGPCAGAESDAGIGEPLMNGDVPFNPLSGKRAQDFSLSFSLGGGTASGTTCVTTLCTPSPANGPENNGIRGATAPWVSREQYGPPLNFPNGIVRRADLKPAGQTWFTFYAFVGASTQAQGFLFPDSNQAAYGSSACGSFTSGVHGGWDCDPANWYNAALGGSANTLGQRVGARYHFIDIDCYDGAVGGGSGLFASLTPFSNDPPCPPVP